MYRFTMLLLLALITISCADVTAPLYEEEPTIAASAIAAARVQRFGVRSSWVTPAGSRDHVWRIKPRNHDAHAVSQCKFSMRSSPNASLSEGSGTWEACGSKVATLTLTGRVRAVVTVHGRGPGPEIRGRAGFRKRR